MLFRSRRVFLSLRNDPNRCLQRCVFLSLRNDPNRCLQRRVFLSLRNDPNRCLQRRVFLSLRNDPNRCLQRRVFLSLRNSIDEHRCAPESVLHELLFVVAGGNSWRCWWVAQQSIFRQTIHSHFNICCIQYTQHHSNLRVKS